MRFKITGLVLFSALFLFIGQAHAADGATIAFRSGQIAFIDNGYEKVLEAMESLERESKDHKIVKLTISGGTFLLNVAEVVLVCRDRCTSVEFRDLRDPKRDR